MSLFESHRSTMMQIQAANRGPVWWGQFAAFFKGKSTYDTLQMKSLKGRGKKRETLSAGLKRGKVWSNKLYGESGEPRLALQWKPGI